MSPQKLYRGILAVVMVILLICNTPLTNGTEINPQVISYCNSTTEWKATGAWIDTSDTPNELDLSSLGVVSSLVWNLTKSTSCILLNNNLSNRNETLPYWDLSQSDYIQFWMKVDVPCSCNAYLFLRSDNTTSSGDDFYAYTILLNFVGWKKFQLKKSNFRKSNSPVSWATISQIRFSTSYTGASVRISDFTTYDLEGPVISDAKFFDTLNLDYSGLTKVKQFVSVKDFSNARSAFCSYLKFERTNVPWSFNPRVISSKGLSSTYMQRSNVLLTGVITNINIPYQFPDPYNVNWTYNPTAEIGSTDSYDPSWTFHLNRMNFWNDLGKGMWYANGTSRFDLAQNYTNLFISHLRSWIKTQPRPNYSNTEDYFTWQTIEVGLRLSVSWAEVYHRFLTVLPCDDLILLVKSYYEQAVYLTQYRSSTGNWLTMESNGLFTAGAIFPEFKLASQWRNLSITTMYNETMNQFLPDGAQFELSTGYHHVAITNIIDLYLTGQTVGILDQFPLDYIDRLQKALEYDVILKTPSNLMPGPLNDGWDVNIVSYLSSYYTYFPNSSLINWVMNQNTAPYPSFKSIYLPNANFAIMRSGWASNDHYALMDIAALGYAHQHDDKLNIIIEPYGRSRLLFDNGGGYYETDESLFRNYAISTQSHNSVLVDGLSQKRQNHIPNDMMGYGSKNTPEPQFETTPLFDYARGWYIDGYKNTSYFPATHSRELIFIKENNDTNCIPMFLIVDEMRSMDGKHHTYEARWHLRTTSVSFNSTQKSISTTDRSVPNLAIIALNRDTKAYYAINQTEPIILGFDVQRGYDPSPATTFVTSQYGLNKTIVTLAVPLKVNESLTITSIQEIIPASSFRIAFLRNNTIVVVEFNITTGIDYLGKTERRVQTKQIVNTTPIYESISPTPNVNLNASNPTPKPSQSITPLGSVSSPSGLNSTRLSASVTIHNTINILVLILIIYAIIKL